MIIFTFAYHITLIYYKKVTLILNKVTLILKLKVFEGQGENSQAAKGREGGICCLLKGPVILTYPIVFESDLLWLLWVHACQCLAQLGTPSIELRTEVNLKTCIVRQTVTSRKESFSWSRTGPILAWSMVRAAFFPSSH